MGYNFLILIFRLWRGSLELFVLFCCYFEKSKLDMTHHWGLVLTPLFFMGMKFWFIGVKNLNMWIFLCWIAWGWLLFLVFIWLYVVLLLFDSILFVVLSQNAYSFWVSFFWIFRIRVLFLGFNCWFCWIMAGLIELEYLLFQRFFFCYFIRFLVVLLWK